VDEEEWLGRRFEEHRAHLRPVAYPLLGSNKTLQVVPRKGGFQIAKDLLYRGNLLVLHGCLLWLLRELVSLPSPTVSHQACVTGLTYMTPQGGGM